MATLKKPLVITSGKIQQLQSDEYIEVDSTANVSLLTNAYGSTIVIGTPVYAVGIGTVDRAIATGPLTSLVVGLAKADANTGTPIQVVTSGVMSATTGEWDDVTASEGLIPGITYFLSGTVGLISSTPPSSGYVVPVGVPLTDLIFLVKIGEPILL